MKRIVFSAILVILFFYGGFAQEKEKQDIFKITPTGSIPANLEESFEELKKLLTPELIAKMRQDPEAEMSQYHMGLGLWMRNNWGLWRGSPLKTYFNGIGIFHPDDMSGIILVSFWRHLNTKPINLNEQVAEYQLFWKVNREPEEKLCPFDKSVIEITVQFDVSEKNRPRTIHTGRCQKKRHYWAYEYDRGWYKPDADLVKKIKAAIAESEDM